MLFIITLRQFRLLCQAFLAESKTTVLATELKEIYYNKPHHNFSFLK